MGMSISLDAWEALKLSFSVSASEVPALTHSSVFERCVEQVRWTTCSRCASILTSYCAASCDRRLVTQMTFDLREQSCSRSQRRAMPATSQVYVWHAARSAFERILIGQLAKPLRLSNQWHRLTAARTQQGRTHGTVGAFGIHVENSGHW